MTEPKHPFVVHKHDPGTGSSRGVYSMGQLVAYNLASARKKRNLTQSQLGERLEGLTATPWSKATVSAAEGGWDAGPTGRTRTFGVSELLAFALALDVPLVWFFLPPEEWRGSGPDEQMITTSHRASPTFIGITSGDLARYATDFSAWDADDEDDPIAKRLRRTCDCWDGKSKTDVPDAAVLLQRIEALEALVRTALEVGKEGETTKKEKP